LVHFRTLLIRLLLRLLGERLLGERLLGERSGPGVTGKLATTYIGRNAGVPIVNRSLWTLSRGLRIAASPYETYTIALDS
jgi:hypothetical protein